MQNTCHRRIDKTMNWGNLGRFNVEGNIGGRNTNLPDRKGRTFESQCTECTWMHRIKGHGIFLEIARNGMWPNDSKLSEARKKDYFKIAWNQFVRSSYASLKTEYFSPVQVEPPTCLSM